MKLGQKAFICQNEFFRSLNMLTNFMIRDVFYVECL